MELAIYAVILAAAAVGAIQAVRHGPGAVLNYYAFLVPWFGLQTNIGITITFDRIAAVLLLALVALRSGLAGVRGMGTFYAFIMLNTVAQSVSLPESVADYSLAQGQWRWAFQLIMWTLLIGPGAVIAAAGVKAASAVYQYLVLSASVLAALAVIQFITYYTAGVDLFPIGIFGDAEQYRAGAFTTDSFLGGTVFRACALGGEPKHLAYSLVVALTIIAAHELFGGLLSMSPRRRRAMAALLMLALGMTFSTQGYSLLVGNMLLMAIFAAAVRGITNQAVRVLGAAAFLVGVVLLTPGLAEVLEARTIDRLVETRGLEDWNVAVWAWLVDSPGAIPLGVGLGNVHLYAAPYIPSEYLFFMKGNVFVAKAGFLRLLSECGIVGLLLFLAAWLRPLRRLVSEAGHRGGASGAHAAVAGLVVVDWLLSGDGPTFVFMAVGAAVAASLASSESASVDLRDAA